MTQYRRHSPEISDKTTKTGPVFSCVCFPPGSLPPPFAKNSFNPRFLRDTCAPREGLRLSAPADKPAAAYNARGYIRMLDKAVKKAVHWCIEHGVLPDFLQTHGSEVVNMLLTEWNWDDALEVRGQEAWEDARAEYEPLIADAQRRIADRDARIAADQQCIADRDARIAADQAEIAALRAQLAGAGK
jgi:hypothetical protein